LLGVAAFTVAQYALHIPLPFERVIIFPMTLVPNLWGLWNILWVGLLAPRRISIGLFGALLPFLLAPGGLLLAHLFAFTIPRVVPYFFPVGVIVYYLAWKHLVARLNAIIGVA